ncbi:MAG: ATP-binding protein [Nitrospinota bacterium]|nr:ATP-binding protein [Nitrospinota bacterium]
MFKWGLFKKDLADTDLPVELAEQMKDIYSNFSGSDRVVLVMDQLRQIISEQKNEMTELLQSVQELESRLDQAYREKNFQADLLTSMCDEIQAPIHTLNQLGDWLNQTHLDANQRACFNFYRVTGRKLHHLFKNIIDVARLREGVFHLEPISFQLNDVMREIIQTLNLTAQEKGVSLSLQIDPDVPQYLIGDVRRLEQILISLVNNAIKFTFEGEVQVRVHLGLDEGAECVVKFLVLDSGVGIPVNQVNTIFERLAQGDPDVERNYGGTGLGLFICKCLVEQMDGTIWAENRKSGGATFGFDARFEKGSVQVLEEQLMYLPDTGEVAEDQDVPVYEIPEEEVQEMEIEGHGDAGGEVHNNNGHSGVRRILLADDCEDTCRLIERFLEDGSYSVEIVHDGQAALEKYEGGSYDLVLMDIQMPLLDGVGATVEIRSREGENGSRIPIIALVGDASEAEGYYLAADFDRCLIKPVSKGDLIEAIGSLLPV